MLDDLSFVALCAASLSDMHRTTRCRYSDAEQRGLTLMKGVPAPRGVSSFYQCMEHCMITCSSLEVWQDPRRFLILVLKHVAASFSGRHLTLRHCLRQASENHKLVGGTHKWYMVYTPQIAGCDLGSFLRMWSPRSLPAASVWNPLPAGSEWVEFDAIQPANAETVPPAAETTEGHLPQPPPSGLTTDTPPVSRVHSKKNPQAKAEPARPAQSTQPTSYPRNLPRSNSNISRDPGRQRKPPSRQSSRRSSSRGLSAGLGVHQLPMSQRRNLHCLS